MFPKTEGKGIHFFNMEQLLVPVLPQEFLEQPTHVRVGSHEWGAYYEFRHVMKNDENIAATVTFYHSMKEWNFHMEDIVKDYLAMLGEDKQASYEREKGVISIAIDDGSLRFEFRICTDSDSERYVIELVKDGHRSVNMFVLEEETFFSVQISGLTESPSVEYLQSFSTKVYED